MVESEVLNSWPSELIATLTMVASRTVMIAPSTTTIARLRSRGLITSPVVGDEAAVVVILPLSVHCIGITVHCIAQSVQCIDTPYRVRSLLWQVLPGARTNGPATCGRVPAAGAVRN